MYSPSSLVYFCNVPLEKNGENQVQFSTREEQTAFFLNHRKQTLSDVNFIRKDNAFKVIGNVETFYNCNYVMYNNAMFSNKMFFAFIDKFEYVNENTALIYISTDTFQTWYFEHKVNESFIVRESPYTDNYNNIADNVAHGQLEMKYEVTAQFKGNGAYLVFCSSDPTQNVTTDSTPYVLNIGHYSVPCWCLYFKESDYDNMSKVVQRIGNKGWGDRIVSAVYVPCIFDNEAVSLTHLGDTAIGDIDVCDNIDIVGALYKELSVNRQYLNGLPKKFFTYPYSKIMIEDMTTGQTVELSPEKFASDIVSVAIESTVTTVPSYKVIPTNYEGQLYSYNNALVTACDTSLPVSNNNYATYLMQNKQSNDVGKVASGISTLSSIFQKNVSGTMGGITSIMGIMARESEAQTMGNNLTSVHDNACERIIWNNGVKLTVWGMDYQHEKSAKSFWNWYGYPVSEIATPNLSHSALFNNYFNYIQLKNANISGTVIPQEDMQILKMQYENGLRLWHNAEQFYTYMEG